MGTGLRERKKKATRQAIAEAARELFVERGFEAVTVAEVARLADVSEATVFNYFRTKEDLFFSGLEFFESALLEAVRQRGPGESALTAFRRFLLDGSRALARDERAEVIAAAASVLERSAALRAREVEIIDRRARALALVLAEETGASEEDVEAHVVARSLMAVHYAVLTRVRVAAAAGRRGRSLAALAKREAERGFARLESGLAEYAARR